MMKLTENQLAELFQTNSKKHTSSSDASDCLNASAASSQRLHHLEDLISDHDTAEALKLSMGLKDWSQVMATSIENSRQSWFNLLGMSTPLKTAFATFTFAFVIAVTLPEFSRFDQQQATPSTISQQFTLDDVIHSGEFDGYNDRLSEGGFEGQGSADQDSLFDASFG